MTEENTWIKRGFRWNEKEQCYERPVKKTELRGAYMAGEICMWHDLEVTGSPARKDLIAQAIKDCDKSEEWYKEQIEIEQSSPHPHTKRVADLTNNRITNLHRKAQLLSL